MKTLIAGVVLKGHVAKGQLNGYSRSIRIMTNREYAIKKINKVLKRVDDTRLAEIIIEVMSAPIVCEWCRDDKIFDDECEWNRNNDDDELFSERDCTRGIRKWLQSEDTSKQY